MRKWLFAFFIIPLIANAQYDFDSRYFTMNAASLPEIESLTAASFSLKKVPFLSKKLKTFQMNSNNYRQPVEMAVVVSDNQKFMQREVDVRTIEQQFFGFSTGGNFQYQADGATGVKNIVYKDVRGLDMLDPCPPIGICSRCAPYRIGRGY